MMPLLADLPTLGTGHGSPRGSSTSTGAITTVSTTQSITAPLSHAGLGPGTSKLLPWSLTIPPANDSSMMCVGEGLPPVPRALVDKIVAWRFIEMSEMLLEYWVLGKDDNDPKKAKAKRPKRITVFHMWLQCFTTYAGILGQHHPAFIPELMAYITTISTAVQDFDGQAWVRYDTAYRRWVAASGNLRWSSVNPSIYAMCFTGRASVRARCDLCLRLGHLSKH